MPEEIENITKRTMKEDEKKKQLHITVPNMIFENFCELLPEGVTPTEKIEQLIIQFVFDQKAARGNANENTKK